MPWAMVSSPLPSQGGSQEAMGACGLLLQPEWLPPPPTDVRTPRGSSRNHSFLYLWDLKLTGVGSGSGWPSPLPHPAPSRLPLTPPQVIGEGTWSQRGDWLGAAGRACAPGELADSDSYWAPSRERLCEVRNTQVCPSSAHLSWKLSAEDWASRKRCFQALTASPCSSRPAGGSCRFPGKRRSKAHLHPRARPPCRSQLGPQADL